MTRRLPGIDETLQAHFISILFPSPPRTKHRPAHPFHSHRSDTPEDAPYHSRRQTSLEGVLDFSTAETPLPTPRQAARALLLYTTILTNCASESIPLSPTARTPLLHPFLRALHDYCPAPGKSNVLFVVLHATFPPAFPGDYTSSLHRDPEIVLLRAVAWLNSSLTPPQRQFVYRRLQTIAEDLLHGFFVPLQAAGGRTTSASPLISPRSRGEVDPFQSTPHRLSGLRAACLARGRNRCAITGALDYDSQEAYNALHPQNPSDEDSAVTEVAHIIPHSFNAQNADGTLGDARTYVWRIMNMFDPGISHRLIGAAIDSPSNAITMCGDLHHRFRQLKWYLEPARAAPPHSYTMHLVRGQRMPRGLLPPAGPGAITFCSTAAAPPPDPRLVAFHRACCLMLRMSGAGECMHRVLRDMKDLQGSGVLASDGSSDLGLFWRLNDILGGVMVC